MTFRSALVLLGVGFVLIQRAQSSLLPTASVSFGYPTIIEANGLSNIHIEYHSPIDGHLAIHYGACKKSLSHPSLAHHSVGSTYVGNHHLASRHEHWTDQRPERFVWIVPENVANGGCLHAYSGEDLIGTSQPITVVKRKERRGIALADIAEVEGPWFDGVEYLKAKEPDSVFVAKAKAQRIGILGGGMSGLMTSHLLESVGIHNWTIIESTGRVGGRVHTSYLNNTTPDQYQYQEMGPMRFPVSITYPQNGETIEIKDHKMVFQLADTLNKIHGNDPALSVDFIEWIEDSANAPVDTDKRRPDGTVPGNAEVAANSSLAPTPAQVDNETAVTANEDAITQWQTLNVSNLTEMANNIFRAHKKAIEAGYLSWSEAAYLRYHLNATLNVTDEVDDISDNYDNWLYDNEYFSATTWRTIDKGLSRLPAAFTPLVSNKTLFNSVINELSWNEATQKMTVFYKPRNASWAKSSSIDFDYVVTAVPFSKVRLWRMPAYSSLLSRAIGRYSYDPACKVALMYKTRFWEHLEYPIIGGCGSVNITGIGDICYPSYKINSTGPGVLLASYIEIDALTNTLQALSDGDHVALVQRAMVDVHGEIADEQFTGIYDRVCWGTNPDQAGAWLGPLGGQQQLYLPSFFNTEFHTVFVGEHTSYVHAWIWSALESGVRGTVQLLLDMGLVDEAKQITQTWMARWLTL